MEGAKVLIINISPTVVNPNESCIFCRPGQSQAVILGKLVCIRFKSGQGHSNVVVLGIYNLYKTHVIQIGDRFVECSKLTILTFFSVPLLGAKLMGF